MKIPRRALRADVPSVAMGDIAFNLLIFFVILARAQDDSHVKWQPASATALERTSNAKISVAIDNANKLFLNGQELGQAQLAARVGDMLGDRPSGKRTVLLKVHKEATALYYEPVIESISEAGGELVHVLEQARQSKN
jgi:biopolymer transport protein ExbD